MEEKKKRNFLFQRMLEYFEEPCKVILVKYGPDDLKSKTLKLGINLLLLDLHLHRYYSDLKAGSSMRFETQRENFKWVAFQMTAILARKFFSA